jgi:hypothetical protein
MIYILELTIEKERYAYEVFSDLEHAIHYGLNLMDNKPKRVTQKIDYYLATGVATDGSIEQVEIIGRQLIQGEQ